VPAGLGGRLLFTRDLGLWTLGLSDGHAQQIVAPPDTGQVTAARWSPDGSQVAYTMFELRERRFAVGEVYMAGADGSGNRKVIAAEQQNTVYQFPVWAPDGRRLYIMHLSQAGTERIRQIEIVDPTTDQRDPVTDASGPYDVSADGRWLAIVRSSGTGNDLTLLDLRSSESRVVLPPGSFDFIGAPRFDPTGQSILFSAPSEQGAWRTGTPEIALTSWLKPAVALAHGPPQDVYSVPTAGGQARRLLSLNADEPVATWSPDAKNLAVLSYEGLATAPATGGTPRTVLRPGSYGSVDWAP
jgi:Tol biopolymer transport system component